MPTYIWSCPAGCIFERYVRLVNFHDPQACPAHGYHAERMIQAPMLVKVAQDVCYDSPIDGRPITSWEARKEDLKRNHCRPYDPEIKKDTMRLKKEADDKLDKSIEATVEAAIEKMPTKKRARLHSELIEQSADVSYNRATK